MSFLPVNRRILAFKVSRSPGVLALCWLLCCFVPLHLGLAWDADRVQAAAARHGENALMGVRLLRQVVAPIQGQSELVQVNTINEFYNRRVLFREDQDNWGQPDYWTSPLELLQRGAGDCEDYAIAKYFTLTAMGVPHKKLRMVYVRAVMGGPGGPSVAHMVLAYYPTPDAEPLVLDNLITEVRPAGRRPDLTPVFSFNAEGLWEGVSAVNVAGNPSERLSRWRDILRRAALDGLY
ncbi:transglutaminase-like cysteine peptidase [Ideonella paludis]|nr:transglutaminase-like cysteine peptidase [Ideonella paludis]